MFLITTAEERTWKRDEKTLFLGEWCKLFSRRHIWSEMDYEVLYYHWDDRNKLYADYIQLNKIYERLLKVLATQLNDIHSVDCSIRYWRIIIGPWLKLFINILYDRYMSIKTAAKKSSITDTWLLKSHYSDWVPMNQTEYYRFISSDSYNHFLYGEIIKSIKCIPYTIIETINDSSFEKRYLKELITNSSGSKVQKRWIREIIPSSFQKAIFFGTGLKSQDLWKLKISLGQVSLDIPRDYSLEVFDCEVNDNVRDQIKLKQGENSFEILCGLMIPKQIPKAYIEGFESLRKAVKKLYPINPHIIFIGNSRYNKDEVLKMWVADNVAKGSKLCIGQHGGHFGTGLWCDSEDHQITISDRFFTWGWECNKHSKVKVLPSAKIHNAVVSLRRKNDGFITLLLNITSRYAYRLFSVPVGGQNLNSFEYNKRFANALSHDVLDLLWIRLYPKEDYDWSQFERIKDLELESKISTNGYSMYHQLRESRLSIHTSNTTSYMETLAANYPTLAFWNPLHWEIRPEAEPYFELLKNVGILHYSPESAAKKVNEIFDSVDSWWNSVKIQEAKNEFVRRFAYTSDDLLKEWKNELTTILKKS